MIVPVFNAKSSQEFDDLDKESPEIPKKNTKPVLFGLFIAIVGVIGSALLLLHIIRRERKEIENEFEVIIREMSQDFQMQVMDIMRHISMMAQHMSVLSNPQIEDFFILASGVIKLQPSLVGAAWAPLLPHSRRDEWEQYISQVYNRTLFVSEPNGTRRGNQSFYNPLSYMHAYDSTVILLDNFATPSRKALFEEAMTGGKPVVSPPYRLIRHETSYPDGKLQHHNALCV